MRDGVVTDGYLVNVLRGVVKQLPGCLENPNHWDGFYITESQSKKPFGYFRFTYRGKVCGTTSKRVFVVGIHLFPILGNGAMHNHRFPFAILPFASNGRIGVPLYEMPWEVRSEGRDELPRGNLSVLSGYPYAIERCLNTYHSVNALRTYWSVNVADVTNQAAREDRLTTSELDSDATLMFLAIARDVVRKYLNSL